MFVIQQLYQLYNKTHWQTTMYICYPGWCIHCSHLTCHHLMYNEVDIVQLFGDICRSTTIQYWMKEVANVTRNMANVFIVLKQAWTLSLCKVKINHKWREKWRRNKIVQKLFGSRVISKRKKRSSWPY